LCFPLLPFFCLHGTVYDALAHHSEQWQECSTVLAPFPELRPIVILITWNYFYNDHSAHAAMLNALWNDWKGKKELKSVSFSFSSCEFIDVC
jgi:hypothetical protein